MKARRKLGLCVAIISLLIAQFLTLGTASAAPLPYQAIFRGPAGMALNDGHLWVADSLANDVVELNAATGSYIRTVKAAADCFKTPSDIASTGRYLWVTSGDCVTQLNASDGSLVRVLKAANYHFDYPGSIVYGDGHIWMVNGGNARSDASIVELSPTNGSLVRVINSSNLASPVALTISGSNVWVANEQNSTVADYSATDGSLIRVLSPVTFNTAGFTITKYHFDSPAGIATSGADVWVSNSDGNPLTEINGSTGALVRVVRNTAAWSLNATDSPDGPGGIAATGTHIWVANGGNVVELNANNGKLIRVVGATADDFDNAYYVVANRQYVWTTSAVGLVVQLNATNGKLVRLIQSRKSVHGTS